MKIKNCLKILSVVGLFCAPSVAQANDNFDKTADIEILRALTIREDEPLNFGVIDLPGANGVKVQIDTNGNILTPSNPATHIDTTNLSEGEYTISGSDSSSISITARDLATYSDISFDSMHASYGNGTATDLMDGTGLTNLAAPTSSGPNLGTKLKIGAVLNVAANTPEASYAPAFQLNIDYQ